MKLSAGRITGLALVGLIFSQQLPANESPQAQTGTTQVAVIRILEQPNLIRELVGVVFSPDNQAISSEVPGIVRSQRHPLGTVFKKGNAIVQLDDREAKARHALVLAECERAKVALKRGQLAFDRVATTYQNKLSSKAEYDEAQLELQQAKNDLMIANAKLNIASLHVEKHTIVAPFDGSLVTSSPSFGKQIMPGDPIVEIINHENLNVRAYFSATEMTRLKHLDYRLRLRTGNENYLTLRQHAPASRSKSGMFETEFSLPAALPDDNAGNPVLERFTASQSGFLAGQVIKLQLVENRLSVPAQAIAEDNRGKYVLTVSNNAAMRVPLDEIQMDHKVIVMGQGDVIPGQRVESYVLSDVQ